MGSITIGISYIGVATYSSTFWFAKTQKTFNKNKNKLLCFMLVQKSCCEMMYTDFVWVFICPEGFFLPIFSPDDRFYTRSNYKVFGFFMTYRATFISDLSSENLLVFSVKCMPIKSNIFSVSRTKFTWYVYSKTFCGS